MSERLPYATTDIEAVPGTIKQRYEDFIVDEIPAYEPCGDGDHVYFRIEKSGLSTSRAIRDIARALGAPSGRIGAAGMKDARGITRQLLSLEHASAERVRALEIPRIRVLEVTRHRNKLRMGHLRGNRFTIRLRDVDVERIDDVRKVLRLLSERGVPNYFGPQRFGIRGDTWQVGHALLRGEFQEAAEVIAGGASPRDTGDVLHARELFDAGEYAKAAKAWPSGFGESVSICRGLDRHPGDYRRVVLGLQRRILGFYVSACQSRVFNHVLAQRIDSFGIVECGDVAWKHDSGAVFVVEDADVENPRAMRFEISPTGPLFGPKMKIPRGAVFEREHQALRDIGLSADSFVGSGPLRAPGGRRPLRFCPENVSAQAGTDAHGAYVELGFALPPGCYATAILREIVKVD